MVPMLVDLNSSAMQQAYKPAGRLLFLKNLTKEWMNLVRMQNVDLGRIADLTEGFTAGQLVQMLWLVKLKTRNLGRAPFTQLDFEREIEPTRNGDALWQILLESRISMPHQA